VGNGTQPAAPPHGRLETTPKGMWPIVRRIVIMVVAALAAAAGLTLAR